MSELLVLPCVGEQGADQALLELTRIRAEPLVDRKDVAVVVRDRSGRVTVRQAHGLAAYGAADGRLVGGFWGLLVGTLFLSPKLGWACGTVAAGAARRARAALARIGIDDAFAQGLGAALKPGSSALLVLVRSTPAREPLLEAVARFPGPVLRASLLGDAEARLRRTFRRDTA